MQASVCVPLRTDIEILSGLIKITPQLFQSDAKKKTKKKASLEQKLIFFKLGV